MACQMLPGGDRGRAAAGGRYTVDKEHDTEKAVMLPSSSESISHDQPSVHAYIPDATKR